MNRLSNITIILVETSHPGNIGAVARAMKNMGVMNLVLVNPEMPPDDASEALAGSAGDIIKNSTMVSTLAEAIADQQFIVGTSARSRKVSLPCKEMTDSVTDVAYYAGQKIKCGIVFGRERTGLYNNEMLKCHAHAYISTNPDYPSLNLSHAVQLCCYLLRQKAQTPINTQQPSKERTVSQNALATGQQVEGFYNHFEQMMTAIGFIDPANPGQVPSKLRRMFQRIHMQQNELHIMRGICNKIIQNAHRHK
jgi:tRNA (cytidine32/uridine32-2'-O)-methyltransferase